MTDDQEWLYRYKAVVRSRVELSRVKRSQVERGEAKRSEAKKKRRTIMYHIKVKVRGIAPVAFNQPPEELRRSGAIVSDAERAAEVEKRIYKNGQGVFFPYSWFKKCMLEGSSAANQKLRGNLSLGPLLNGVVNVLEQELLTGKPTYDFIYARWGRVPPGKRGKLVKLRSPALNIGWETSLTLVVADDAMDSDLIQTALATGGLYKGVGNNRPEFGRFEIIEWEIGEGFPEIIDSRRIEHSLTQPSEAESSLAESSRTEQNRTEQNKAKRRKRGESTLWPHSDHKRKSNGTTC